MSDSRAHGKDGTSSCEIIIMMELIDFRLCADRADREEGGAPEWQSGVSTVAELR